jgi:hypothetical protein
MRRRKFIGALDCLMDLWPRVAKAQGAAKRALVAVLVAGSSLSVTRFLSGFRQQGLQELGYVEGRNIDLVDRYADGDMSRLPALADWRISRGPFATGQ